MNEITFDGKSASEWGLKLLAVYIPMPGAKTNYLDIPGADGSLDVTEVFGSVPYSDREGATFTFDHLGGYEQWQSDISALANYLHGQKRRIILPYDDWYYYIGRLAVDADKSDHVTGRVVISGRLEPYKLERFSSLEEWEWDSFDFETGVIREYKELAVDGIMTLEIPGTKKPVIPVFICSGALTVAYEGVTYELPAGESHVLNIEIREGGHTLIFSGNGKVSVEYRGGSL